MSNHVEVETVTAQQSPPWRRWIGLVGVVVVAVAAVGGWAVFHKPGPASLRAASARASTSPRAT